MNFFNLLCHPCHANLLFEFEMYLFHRYISNVYILCIKFRLTTSRIGNLKTVLSFILSHYCFCTTSFSCIIRRQLLKVMRYLSSNGIAKYGHLRGSA